MREIRHTPLPQERLVQLIEDVSFVAVHLIDVVDYTSEEELAQLGIKLSRYKLGQDLKPEDVNWLMEAVEGIIRNKIAVADLMRIKYPNDPSDVDRLMRKFKLDLETLQIAKKHWK